MGDRVPSPLERFKQNLDGFFRKFAVLLGLVSVAALADMLSTIHVMCRQGTGSEVHPVIRLVSWLLGPIVGPLVGKLGQLGFVVLLAIYLRRWAAYILALVAALYLWAAWYNVWGYQVYTPLLLKYLPVW